MRLNKDNVINAFCIFSIVATICIILVLVLKLFFGQIIDINFIKDIFSIGSTLAAALIAISLFNDWKDQHNKQVEDSFSNQVIEAYDIFEKSLYNYIFSINQLNSLISSYSEYELSWEILKIHGHFGFYSKIQESKDVLDKDFYNLLSKTHNYYNFKNKNNFHLKHELYFNKFIDINKKIINTNNLRDEIIDINTKIIGYRDLKDIYYNSEIKIILKNSIAH